MELLLLLFIRKLEISLDLLLFQLIFYVLLTKANIQVIY